MAELIGEPVMRARTLLTIADSVPAGERERKLALLERAAIHARASNAVSFSVYEMGEVADRLYDLGEKEKAKAFFDEGLKRANEDINKTSPQSARLVLAARCCVVDLLSPPWPSPRRISRRRSQDSRKPDLENIKPSTWPRIIPPRLKGF